MNKNLNLIIKRKNFDNFIKNGEDNMNYRISDETSNIAKQTIVNDEINERLDILKNQLTFLQVDETSKHVSNEDDVNSAKKSLAKLEDFKSVLNFKKQNLQMILDEKLSQFDIMSSAKIKEDLNKIDEEFLKINKDEKKFNSIITNDELDYASQMYQLKEKYDGVDILKNEIIDNNFSESVVKDYKRYRAGELVIQFLDSLSEDKKQQVLNENENLKGYLNVGENF